jgi:hypothetical protein
MRNLTAANILSQEFPFWLGNDYLSLRINIFSSRLTNLCLGLTLKSNWPLVCYVILWRGHQIGSYK